MPATQKMLHTPRTWDQYMPHSYSDLYLPLSAPQVLAGLTIPIDLPLASTSTPPIGYGNGQPQGLDRVADGAYCRAQAPASLGSRQATVTLQGLSVNQRRRHPCGAPYSL